LRIEQDWTVTAPEADEEDDAWPATDKNVDTIAAFKEPSRLFLNWRTGWALLPANWVKIADISITDGPSTLAAKELANATTVVRGEPGSMAAVDSYGNTTGMLLAASVYPTKARPLFQWTYYILSFWHHYSLLDD
jgi:hypothetical protein